MKVIVCVPRRSDGGHRDRLWEFCRSRWVSLFSDWEIREGEPPAGPFNRSAALNQAAHGEWDVALLIDSDIVSNPEATRSAVEIAAATGQVVVSHHERVMLNRTGTDKILAGYDGPWRVRSFVERVWTDSVSCCVAVPRAAWETVGGMDERFVGWGYEDSAFMWACDTLTGPHITLASELFHLWHPPTPEAAKTAPTNKANQARMDLYREAAGSPDAMRALLAEGPPSRIPRILHRTVPAETTDEVETWWQQARQLHPGWDLRTYREPIDPADWPLTGDLFDRCQNGAQKAGLIRLECLYRDGGIYLDSDVEPFRSLEPLLSLPAFAGWEDETTCPDAVLGSEPSHPAFGDMIAKARSVIEGGGDAWQSGPGVTTETLPNRSDVLLLPPGAFYPYSYLQKHLKDSTTAEANPWAYCAHHWAHSWGSPEQRRSIERRQRR